MAETDAWHIPEDLFERFLRAEVSKKEGRAVVRHLVAGCPRCTEVAHRITTQLGLWPKGKPNWEHVYEEVFRRAFAFATEEERRIALERLRGWGQWAALEPLNPQVRFAAIDADPSYHTFGLYDRLLEASRLYMRREPAEAVDIVRLAILVAERLDPSRHGRERIADLRASAWAELGNTKRLASDFEGARRAFNEAWRILEDEGTNDPLEQAISRASKPPTSTNWANSRPRRLLWKRHSSCTAGWVISTSKDGLSFRWATSSGKSIPGEGSPIFGKPCR